MSVAGCPKVTASARSKLVYCRVSVEGGVRSRGLRSIIARMKVMLSITTLLANELCGVVVCGRGRSLARQARPLAGLTRQRPWRRRFLALTDAMRLLLAQRGNCRHYVLRYIRFPKLCLLAPALRCKRIYALSRAISLFSRDPVTSPNQPFTGLPHGRTRTSWCKALGVYRVRTDAKYS